MSARYCPVILISYRLAPTFFEVGDRAFPSMQICLSQRVSHCNPFSHLFSEKLIATKSHKKSQKREREKLLHLSPLRFAARALAEQVFLDLEFRSPEIDQQAGFPAACLQISEQLRHMLAHQSSARFQLNHQAILHKKIRKEFAQFRSIFIIHHKRILLLNLYPLLAKPMNQGILVDLFQMSVPVILGAPSKARSTC
jgi:hypothetical protein